MKQRERFRVRKEGRGKYEDVKGSKRGVKEGMREDRCVIEETTKSDKEEGGVLKKKLNHKRPYRKKKIKNKTEENEERQWSEEQE